MATRQNNTRGGALPAASPPALDWLAPSEPMQHTVAALADAADAAALVARTWENGTIIPTSERGYAFAVETTGWQVSPGRSIPPIDGLVISARERSLVTQGWQFIAVPRLVKSQDRKALAPLSLSWEAGRRWLALPPEVSDLPGRTFDRKGGRPQVGGERNMSATRRGLFAAASVLPLAGVAVAQQSSPDAELIALCRQYGEIADRIIRTLNAMPEHYDWRQEKAYDAEHLDPLYEEKSALVDRIQPIRARTLAGLLARIEMFAKDSPHLLDEQNGLDETMISGILLDGLAIKAGGLA